MPVWNGECSDYFTVANGVKQSGIVSAVLFCVYLDGLLLALSDAKVGCYIGKVYVGALAYGDDVTLLAPTPRAMRLQLQIYEKYSQKFRIEFNAVKSACMVVGRKTQRRYYGMQFSIDGKDMEFVEEFSHLGHVLSSNLDDKSEIINKRNSLCGKSNNVLCYFRNCDPLLKVKFMSHYCHDFDCCALWDSTHSVVEDLSMYCLAQRPAAHMGFAVLHSFELAGASQRSVAS